MTQLDFSITFCSLVDGHSELVVYILEGMFCTCFIDFFYESWERRLSYVENAYRNSYRADIGIFLFETLKDIPCRSYAYWTMIEGRTILKPSFIWDKCEDLDSP